MYLQIQYGEKLIAIKKEAIKSFRHDFQSKVKRH